MGAVLSAEQIQTYWQSVDQDRKLKSWRTLHVSTNVIGQVRSLPKASLATAGEGSAAIDPFEAFEQYDLALEVQDLIEKKQEPEQRQEQPKIETYGVLEGILKYATEHVLLVGKPGSGKTTALERLLAEGNLIAGRLPIFLRLRDLNPKLIHPVLERLRLGLLKRGLRFSLETLEELLQRGQFLLLFDGINELPAPGLRRAVQDFRERYRPTTPMIFTTRPLNVGIDLGIEKKLEMKPLSPAQMQEFVQKHLGCKQGDAFFKQLKDRLRQFGETPLLLWMLCGLFRNKKQIPANLGEAFRWFASIYEDKKELAENRFWQSRFLQALAVQMMPQGGDPFGLRMQISRQEAEELLAEALGISLLEASRKLTLLLSEHLLQLQSQDELEFKHQLFQEYYAAEYLLAQLPHLSDRELQKYYLNLLDWSEVVALVAGLVQTEAAALRLTRLGLEVDWYWGARLAGEVPQPFQTATVGLVAAQSVAQSLSVELRVELLEKTRSKTAVPGLLNALKHEDSDVCVSAAAALGQLQSEAAIPRLLKALEHKDSDVCVCAAAALGQLQSEAAIPGLLKALEHENWQVRQNAAAALGQLQSEATIPGLLKALEHEDLNVRGRAAAALGQLQSEAAIPGLLKALEHENWQVRRSAAQALGQLQSEAVIPGLLKALMDENWEVRQSAADWLGELQNETTVPGLLKALADENWQVRQIAAAALGQLQSEAAIPGLLKALADENWQVCWIAAKALGQLQSEAAIPELLNALEHGAWDVRRSAAEALGQLQSEVAIPGLLNALEDKSSHVRWSAATALGQLQSEAAIPGLLKALADESLANSAVRGRVAAVLGQLQSEAAIPGLLNALKHEDSDVCVSAAAALGQLQSEAAIPGLLKALEHENWQVRQNAAAALGQLQSEATIPGLLKALEHEDLNVRGRAAVALGQLQNEAAIPGLLKALADEGLANSVVRGSAAKALGQLQSEVAIPGLLKALEHEDPYVCWSAAAALEELESEAAILPIWQQHRQDPQYWLKAAIQTLQDKCKRYNYEISQTELPLPQAAAEATVVHIINNISGGQFGDLVMGNKTTTVQLQLEALLAQLQQQFSNASATEVTTRLTAQLKTLEQNDPDQWSAFRDDLLNRERWLQDGKAAISGIAQHYADNNPIIKGLIAFLENFAEDIKQSSETR